MPPTETILFLFIGQVLAWTRSFLPSDVGYHSFFLCQRILLVEDRNDVISINVVLTVLYTLFESDIVTT